MTWNEEFTKISKPASEQIHAHIGSPLWDEFCTFLESTYSVQPCIEYSQCSGAPGWNVKYKTGGRSLCTLYPREGYFTCLVSIGSKESMEAELLLSICTEYVQELYQATKPFNGARWLMIDVKSAEILHDVKQLIGIRVKPAK